jgi:RNA polymerase sigma factor (sigma-70 family)
MVEEALRERLVRYVAGKFGGYPNVAFLAEDIVQQAYVSAVTGKQYTAEKENFAYLSVVCLRQGYRLFLAQAQEHSRFVGLDDNLVSEADAVDELHRAEDASVVLESLKTLREIERIVVTQRYYGDFSFAEIAKSNGLKLNTVLSHHRRALEKLRPTLTRLLGYGKEQTDE